MEYYKIGRISGVADSSGRLVLKHDLGKINIPKTLNVIFLEENKSSMLPWFISKIQLRDNDHILLTLEEVATIEAAKKLIHKEVWIKEEIFQKIKTNAPISFLNFEVIENEKLLGVIEEIIEQKDQIIAVIFINKKEVLIPLNEETLQSVDRKNKKIHVQLPDGLLDVYLGAP